MHDHVIVETNAIDTDGAMVMKKNQAIGNGKSSTRLESRFAGITPSANIYRSLV